METWSVHHLSQAAAPVLGKPAADHLKAYAQQLAPANLPVIFTLRHLAKITKVEYGVLRITVERRRESANYRMFAVKKRAGGRRHIHAVTGDLFKVQQFINLELLQKLKPHPASYAFHADGGVRKCASVHCGARWIFQYDLENFFHTLNESDAYRVFMNAGYRPLLAFELARLCTTTRLPDHLKYHLRPKRIVTSQKAYQFYVDRTGAMGVLPQGAPTSPMLSNLAAFGLDEKLTALADLHGFIYTRYADDLIFSAGGELPTHMSIGDIHRVITKIIRKCGFRENIKKTRIAGPGSKKVVLGLLVDGPIPRLSKETYKRIDRHLYATQKYGLVAVAEHEKFDSAIGFYNHLSG
ncbi:reverse transcriptase family protein [Sneathiella sp.]|uniref:reverse transcriptase family protein n=1 Tax=Sneathiella sp. TaxID=1964365 RepID=UPI003563DC91